MKPSSKRQLVREPVHPKLQPKNGAPLFEYTDNGGFVHAPSLNHASAAAVLRAGYMAHATKRASGRYGGEPVVGAGAARAVDSPGDPARPDDGGAARLSVRARIARSRLGEQRLEPQPLHLLVSRQVSLRAASGEAEGERRAGRGVRAAGEHRSEQRGERREAGRGVTGRHRRLSRHDRRHHRGRANGDPRGARQARRLARCGEGSASVGERVPAGAGQLRPHQRHGECAAGGAHPGGHPGGGHAAQQPLQLHQSRHAPLRAARPQRREQQPVGADRHDAAREDGARYEQVAGRHPRRSGGDHLQHRPAPGRRLTHRRADGERGPAARAADRSRLHGRLRAEHRQERSGQGVAHRGVGDREPRGVRVSPGEGAGRRSAGGDRVPPARERLGHQDAWRAAADAAHAPRDDRGIASAARGGLRSAVEEEHVGSREPQGLRRRGPRRARGRGASHARRARHRDWQPHCRRADQAERRIAEGE